MSLGFISWTMGFISWGSPSWLVPAAAILAIAGAVLLRAYVRAPGRRGTRFVAGALKAAALVALAACLVEPLIVGQRARPRANIVVVLADATRSLEIRDGRGEDTRSNALRRLVDREAEWLKRLEGDFDLRRYVFDSRPRAVDSFEGLACEGEATGIRTSLEAIARQYSGRPVAGIILLSDGVATDTEASAGPIGLPPVHAVPIGSGAPARDVRLARVAISESLFESAPITIQAEVLERGYPGEEILVEVLDQAGERVESTSGVADRSGRLGVRFQLRPRTPGVEIWRVRAAPRGEADAFDDPARSSEATLANNSRLVASARGKGPYRVLYVSGRPNWEFKFLRRAIEKDPEVELVGLVRIAKREPKFDFRSRAGESTNPLFRGFGREGDEEAERYDQPVLVRVGTRDADELREGFPKTEEDLFAYDAIVVDDLEAEFFTRDQMTNIRSFVARRGGGFLMLGGRESFGKGNWARTPIEEILPVYAEALPAPPPDAELRLSLTRDGWLQPWVRLRETEEAERGRLGAMPAFRTLNVARGIKPGAMVLAEISRPQGDPYPALAAQPFGKGRSAALLLGDLWRWSLRRSEAGDDDPARAWRQLVRWLVSEVPGRVETSVSAEGAAVRVGVRVRDRAHQPLDTATVTVEVSGPAGEPLRLATEPSEREAGMHEAVWHPSAPGGWRIRATAKGPDEEEIGADETAWVHEPDAAEYRRLEPDREYLARLARDSGGELVEPSGLDGLAARLPQRSAPISDPRVEPLWHGWWMLTLLVLLLGGEWILRRWSGLP